MHHICHIEICPCAHQLYGLFLIKGCPFAVLISHCGACVLHVRVVEVAASHEEAFALHVESVREIAYGRVYNNVLDLIEQGSSLILLFLRLTEGDGRGCDFLPVVHVDEVGAGVAFHDA